nr:hypothetical protein [Tanacetum cinerariifolium]
MTCSLSHIFRQSLATAGHLSPPFPITGKLFRRAFRPKPNTLLINRSIRSTTPLTTTRRYHPKTIIITSSAVPPHPPQLPSHANHNRRYVTTVTIVSTTTHQYHHYHFLPPTANPEGCLCRIRDCFQISRKTWAFLKTFGLGSVNKRHGWIDIGLSIENRIPNRWSKEVHRYHCEALNGIHHWEEDIIDFFKAGMSAVIEGNIYSDLRIKSLVRVDVKKKWGYGFLRSIVVSRSNDKKYEFSYAYLPRLSENDAEDIRTVIKNEVEDIQHGVESYQRSFNLTKPTIFFEGIDQRIPFTMTAMHKGVVYLNQYNIKSLMNLSEVKKFCDGTLMKIQENLIDMLSKNKLGSSNKRLKGRDWIDYDVKISREMLKKIDEILRHKEHLRRLDEYVGGRPKTVNPRTFVRPL